jgi:glucokinase
MIMMTLGTGIGGAVIIDGKLWTGLDGTAGEIGHLCVIDGGRVCGCGRKGCIEAYASATATVARFKEARSNGEQTSLADKDVSCADIFQAAKKNDALSIRIASETGRLLGLTAANMANLLNPERCIFSGGMIRAWDFLYPAIQNEVNRHGLKTPRDRMKVLPAELGDDAGLIGAAACAMVKDGFTA